MFAPKIKTDQGTVVFVHIPRTGGTTLDSVIRRQYGRRRVFDIYVGVTVNGSSDTSDAWEQYLALTDAERKRLGAVVGHQDLGSQDRYLEAPRYITLLREPVDRILSYYYYAMHNPRHYLHRLMITHRLSFVDFATSQSSIKLDNGQTRQLSGRQGVRIGECTEDMLDEACENLLGRFTAFGLAENYDESLLLFKTALRWHHPYYVPLNASEARRSRATISTAQHDAVAQYNWLDVRLYEFAKCEFERRIALGGADLQRSLASFRKQNALLRPIGNTFNSLSRISKTWWRRAQP